MTCKAELVDRRQASGMTCGGMQELQIAIGDRTVRFDENGNAVDDTPTTNPLMCDGGDHRFHPGSAFCCCGRVKDVSKEIQQRRAEAEAARR